MHKAELIDYENKKHAEKLAKIEQLPDEAFTVEGISAFAGAAGDVVLDKSTDSFDEVLDILHKMRTVLGAYKLESYWMPYSSMLCIRYAFGKTLLWFRLTVKSQEDAQDILDKISGGKCQIVEEATTTIVCNL